MTTTTDRPHGRVKYVKENCRCLTCRQANAAYAKRRKRQRAYGRDAYLDAEPVRQHVKSLQAAGLGWRRIATLAGVHTVVVSKLLYGDTSRGTPPTRRVRPETAAKLLAVRAEFDNLGGKQYVAGVGVRRRLQALMVLGWSRAKLATELGTTTGNLALTMANDRVYVSTARAVSVLYERLWDTPPPESTHRDRIAASRSRQYARDRGWLPPAAWDDDHIDDPEFQLESLSEDQDVDEVAVELCVAGELVPEAQLNGAERRAVAAWVVRVGGGVSQVAQVLGCSRYAAQRLIEDVA